MKQDITVSLVSHGHGEMVEDLCRHLLQDTVIAHVILTLNIAESLEIPMSEKITVIRNSVPQGFAANHNAAFSLCKTKFFVVLNPDVSLGEEIFEKLRESMSLANAKLIAPLVRSFTGEIEDSVRKFPTPLNLMMKALGKDISRYPVPDDKNHIYPDWVAGMFMMFEAVSFAAVKGFDEKFYLYYEDVDICLRFWVKQYPVVVDSKVSIVHHAQRDSRKKLRFMYWHLSSLVRYFYKHLFRLPATGRPDVIKLQSGGSNVM